MENASQLILTSHELNSFCYEEMCELHALKESTWFKLFQMTHQTRTHLAFLVEVKFHRGELIQLRNGDITVTDKDTFPQPYLYRDFYPTHLRVAAEKSTPLGLQSPSTQGRTRSSLPR